MKLFAVAKSIFYFRLKSNRFYGIIDIGLDFSFVPQGTISHAWYTQHHLPPHAAQMNDVTLCAKI